MGAPYLLLLLSRSRRQHAVTHADWLSSIAGVVSSAAAGGSEVRTAAQYRQCRPGGYSGKRVGSTAACNGNPSHWIPCPLPHTYDGDHWRMQVNSYHLGRRLAHVTSVIDGAKSHAVSAFVRERERRRFTPGHVHDTVFDPIAKLSDTDTAVGGAKFKTDRSIAPAGTVRGRAETDRCCRRSKVISPAVRHKQHAGARGKTYLAYSFSYGIVAFA